MRKYHKAIAPRLTSGERRISNAGALPPRVKAALQVIARSEGQSVSWVMEQMVIEYFGIICPSYKMTPKVKTLETKPKHKLRLVK